MQITLVISLALIASSARAEIMQARPGPEPSARSRSTLRVGNIRGGSLDGATVALAPQEDAVRASVTLGLSTPSVTGRELVVPLRLPRNATIAAMSRGSPKRRMP